MQLKVKFYSKFSGRLRAIWHSPESRLRGMLHSADLTRIHEYLYDIETKFENILG
jgi:hypothetical protein